MMAKLRAPSLNILAQKDPKSMTIVKIRNKLYNTVISNL